ncbi:ABC transporter permease [Paenibacillus silvae]|uniref:ABC transporter permease n=1 Tax=Paenibacillus silvae TaxID=1325358 RepID=UPI00200313FD|nr:FtsX-like permease family protein [Paenibacillus silvae]MCK6075320.1 FtsX-like permease family protein [Paenibacillus silvae]MCK6149707.1 FtsX-like permease family protein [Paenibacillus silvae]MCK6268005.1 FtsX-like permease family protein [Paenibacillus silvae]
MLLRMLRNDLMRKKGITAALFIFVLLAALLVSSGSRMIMELTSSIQYLFSESKTPHFVQMHSGELDQAKVNQWAEGNALVEQHQIVEMVNIDGANLYLGAESEKNTVMDIDLVTQNQQFDYLLNLNSEIIQVLDGEIAVPVYYLQQNQLKIGDKVRINNGAFERAYTIVDFVRDAQMNPSVVHSKRFIVSPNDWQELKQGVGEMEYLIEFRLNDPAKTSDFTQAYQNAGLPNAGPVVTYGLFQVLNAMTDGIIAAVIILVSLVLILIAMLCIRFTMLATIEEDYREISVMKAIGIAEKDIKRLYLVKYVFMAGVASVLGYVASLGVNKLFVSNIMLYMGKAPATLLHFAVPLLAAAVIFTMVVLFCRAVLRRFRSISAVEALRTGSLGDTQIIRNRLSLSRNRWSSVPVFLGLKEVMQRVKMFRLLLFVFIVSSFIMIVPINFLNTLQAPSFISYMGVGQSDIRIDLRHTDDIEQRYANLINQIKNDGDVKAYSPLVTSQFKIRNAEGSYDNLSVESGDFSIFPLSYLSGNAPATDRQIALSDANSSELKLKTGDQLTLQVDGKDQVMTVSGIYQDVTNGGKTAKALLPYNKDSVLWYVVSLDLKDRSLMAAKVAAYEKDFSPARVTDLQGYLHQTLGGTIQQLKLVTTLALAIGVFISILITSLFLQMLVAKDNNDIAVLRSLGFALSKIKLKYVVMSLAILIVGVAAGTILSNTLGPKLVSGIMSSFGASNIVFVIDPVQAYVLCPLLLAGTIIITAWISIQSIRETSISKMIVE